MTEPKTFSITLTEQEAAVLMNLLHEAVKSRFDAAEAAVHFKNKIAAAHAESKKAVDDKSLPLS